MYKEDVVDKKRVGAIVGVAGVASVIAASQFINIDASNADYVTKNLEAQYKESLKVMEQAGLPKAAAQSDQKVKGNVAQKVYDPVQKVEYRITTPKQADSTADNSGEEELQKPEEKAENPNRNTFSTADEARIDKKDEEISDRLSLSVSVRWSNPKKICRKTTETRVHVFRRKKRLPKRFRTSRITRIPSFHRKRVNRLSALLSPMY